MKLRYHSQQLPSSSGATDFLLRATSGNVADVGFAINDREETGRLISERNRVVFGNGKLVSAGRSNSSTPLNENGETAMQCKGRFGRSG